MPASEQWQARTRWCPVHMALTVRSLGPTERAEDGGRVDTPTCFRGHGMGFRIPLLWAQGGQSSRREGPPYPPHPSQLPAGSGGSMPSPPACGPCCWGCIWLSSACRPPRPAGWTLSSSAPHPCAAWWASRPPWPRGRQQAHGGSGPEGQRSSSDCGGWTDRRTGPEWAALLCLASFLTCFTPARPRAPVLTQPPATLSSGVRPPFCIPERPLLQPRAPTCPSAAHHPLTKDPPHYPSNQDMGTAHTVDC